MRIHTYIHAFAAHFYCDENVRFAVGRLGFDSLTSHTKTLKKLLFTLPCLTFSIKWIMWESQVGKIAWLSFGMVKALSGISLLVPLNGWVSAWLDDHKRTLCWFLTMQDRPTSSGVARGEGEGDAPNCYVSSETLNFVVVSPAFTRQIEKFPSKFFSGAPALVTNKQINKQNTHIFEEMFTNFYSYSVQTF